MAKPKRASRPGSAGRPGAGHQRAPNTTPTTKQPVRSQSTAASGATGPTRQAGGPSTTAAGGGAGSLRGAAVATPPAARGRAAVPAQTQQPARRRFRRRSWWQQALEGPRAIGATVITVALLVGLFFLLAHNQQGSGGDTTPVPQSVYNAVTQVSPTVISTVGTGGLAQPLKALPANTPPLTSGGKPEFLYIGAEYCPYCAAERWSLIVALSRFGTFSNLHLTTSADAPEVYPNTPTFTFYKSTYTSQYVSFIPVEIQDRQGNTLQTMTSVQQQIFNTYDKPPYASTAGGIPFLAIGGEYATSSSGYLPDVLRNETWNSIAAALSNANSPLTQGIVGNANYLTAAICQTTNNQPANVCTAAPIPQIQAQLPKGS